MEDIRERGVSLKWTEVDWKRPQKWNGMTCDLPAYIGKILKTRQRRREEDDDMHEDKERRKNEERRIQGGEKRRQRRG